MAERAVFDALILFFTVAIASAELVARNSGIQRIERQDIGVVFYLEMTNDGEQQYGLNARMIQCCENISRNDIDCEHMQVIGGDMGWLLPRAKRNLTFIWPTLYPHDRVGECTMAIRYVTKNNETGESHHKIRFDTRVSAKYVPSFLKGYYDPSEVRRCSTVDLDSLDGCRPVNCHAKYSGKRNFFDRRHRRCEFVPRCIADSRKELPDIAYIPASNTCRDLENAVNEAEVRALSRGVAEPAWRSVPQPYLSNIYCHHGRTDNATGFCVCNEGWTSFPIDNLEPSTEMIHLCNSAPFPDSQLASLVGAVAILFCGVFAYLTRRYLPTADRTTCGTPVKITSFTTCSAKSQDTCCYDRMYR